VRGNVALELAAVRRELESACAALILASPDGLAACEASLRRVAEIWRGGLAAWDWNAAAAEARGEAARVQASIRRAACLLSSGARYHAGWQRILAAITCGYSAQGQAVPMPGRGRISVEA